MHHRRGQRAGLRADVVEPQHEIDAEEQHGTRRQANRQVQQLHGARVALHEVHAARADGATDHHRARVRCAEAEHRDDLVHRDSNRIRSDNRLGQPPQDSDLQDVRDTERDALADNGQGDLQKIFEEISVRRDEAAQPQRQPLVSHRKDEDDCDLEYAGDQARPRSTLDAELRRAAVAENEQPVTYHVQNKTDERHHGPEARDAHPTQAQYERRLHGEDEVCHPDNPQVAHRICRHSRLVREQGHDAFGRSHAHDAKQHAGTDRELHGERNDASHRLVVAFAPVLRDEDHTTRTQPVHAGHLQEVLNLVDYGRCCQRRLAVLPEHHVVGEVHRIRQQVLQSHHGRQPEELAVERRVFHQESLHATRLRRGR